MGQRGSKHREPQNGKHENKKRALEKEGEEVLKNTGKKERKKVRWERKEEEQRAATSALDRKK